MGSEVYWSIWWKCFAGNRFGRKRWRYIIAPLLDDIYLVTNFSAAGSVMLQTMAFGGRLGDSLFENVCQFR